MAENQLVKSNRDRYKERLMAKYPDKTYEDDEALFGQINDDYDDYDNQLNTYKDREKTLSDFFASNPRGAAFFTDWRNGEDPIVNLIRKFGDDFKAALEDPDKLEEIAEANKDYAERIAKEKEYEDIYQKNISETLDVLNKVQQEDKLTDDDIDNAMTFLIGIVRDGLMGKFSAESVRMALKAINYETDVKEAGYEGEVKGRNEKIEEKLRKRNSTDGTANLAGKNGGTRQQAMPDFGAIDNNYGTKDIWERGGMKRRQMR